MFKILDGNEMNRTAKLPTHWCECFLMESELSIFFSIALHQNFILFQTTPHVLIQSSMTMAMISDNVTPNKCS